MIPTTTIAVSIIVPVYNVEDYLDECLQSLVNQSLKNIEIIAVNDGSTDNSYKILDKFTQQYPKLIKVYNKTNGGLSDARNHGITKAIGQYIGFVDSDDWVDVDMFKEMFEKATTSSSDIVVCGMMKHIQSKNLTIAKPLKIRGKVSDYDHCVSEKPSLLYASRSYACNKIFIHSFFSEKNYIFPKNQWFEDSALIYTLLFEANKISCVNKNFYHYRFNREGAITSTISPKIFDIFKSCDAILEAYKKSESIAPNAKLIVEKIIRNHIIARIHTFVKNDNKNDRKLALVYTKHGFSYLDKHFRGWKKRYKTPKKKRFSLTWHTRKSSLATYLYLSTPKSLKKKFTSIRNYRKKLSPKRLKIAHKKNVQQKNLQKYAFSTLKKLDKVFNSLSITYFADFGTLLGFVREKNFMAHDLDLDLGVFATEEEKINLYAALQKEGFTLFRSYIHNDKIVEQSYHYTNDKKQILVKFDINFYQNEGEHSKTWLFYYSKTAKLKLRHRKVVEMTYSKISEIDYLQIKGHSIPVPKNYLQLLEEKYGSSWHIPDANWIYWESPAATLLDGTGYYITKYNMPTSKLRELQLEQLKVLNSIESIFIKYDLTYYLAEGTLLGAARHNGYIPWDDDIDISMPREDYERLLSISEDDLPKDILIWAHTTDPNYHLPFAKVVSTLTTNFRNTFPDNIQKKFSGPRIDIFPLDSLKEEQNPKHKSIAKKIRTARTMMLIKAGYSVKKTKRNKFYSYIVPLIKMRTIQKYILKIATLQNQSENKFIVNWFSAYNHTKQTVHTDAYNNPTMIKYEDKLRPVPKEYKYILTKIYGDYMTPPPLNKRNNASHFMIYDSQQK